jgi:hypothetical protein
MSERTISIDKCVLDILRHRAAQWENVCRRCMRKTAVIAGRGLCLTCASRPSSETMLMELR